jgi:D-alanyl-D-alanine carboxypeptidase (penicillin-binding protein 5/6)
MTAYAVFDALRQNTVRLDDTATISENAWRSGGAGTEGSTSFLPVNSRVPVEVLLRGMIVQSGNDASIALAERVAGSEEAFAQLMNAYAKRLGMTGSHFQNATGLPGPEHYTTARDMALLAQAIVRDFPQYYGYFSEQHYTFNNITQPNRNRLLTTGEGVDGLKTGHTKSAGYCLVTSAKRNDMRLVSVVMGAANEKSRESSTSALLNYGFNFFEPKPLFVKAQPLSQTRVWKGAESQVSLATNRDVVVAIPRGRAAFVQGQVQVPISVTAPIAAGAQIGTLNVTLDGKTLLSEPLYAQTHIEQAGFFGRMIDSIWMQFE